MGKTKNLTDKTKNLPKDKEEKSVEKPAKDEDAKSPKTETPEEPAWLKDFRAGKPVAVYLPEFIEALKSIPQDPTLDYFQKNGEEVEKYYAIAKEIVEKPEGDETVEKPEGDTIRKGIYATWNKIKSFFEARRP